MSERIYLHKTHKIETRSFNQISDFNTLSLLYDTINQKTNSEPLQGLFDVENSNILEIPRDVVQFMHDNVFKLTSDDLFEVRINEKDNSLTSADMADMLHSRLEDSDQDNNFIVLSRF